MRRMSDSVIYGENISSCFIRGLYYTPRDWCMRTYHVGLLGGVHDSYGMDGNGWVIFCVSVTRSTKSECHWWGCGSLWAAGFAYGSGKRVCSLFFCFLFFGGDDRLVTWRILSEREERDFGG